MHSTSNSTAPIPHHATAAHAPLDVQYLCCCLPAWELPGDRPPVTQKIVKHVERESSNSQQPYFCCRQQVGAACGYQRVSSQATGLGLDDNMMSSKQLLEDRHCCCRGRSSHAVLYNL